MERSTMVVVGVDDSAGSRAALAHALDEAARRHCWLRVVTAFDPVLYPGITDTELEGEIVRRTREFVNDLLAQHRDGPGRVPVSIAVGDRPLLRRPGDL